MFNGASCRCCLVRPPDKDLYSTYSRLGKPEVYSDMLKECFEIHLPDNSGDEDAGICEICIMRLRDASDFKHQVQRCQIDFRAKLLSIKDEAHSKVKEELAELDEENGILFLEIKDEVSDFEDGLLKEEDEDDKNLAEIMSFNNVSIKKYSSKKGTTKRRLNKKDRKSKKHSSLKLSLRTLTTMNEILQAKKVTTSSLVSENTKHKFNIENLLKHSNCTPFSNKTLSGIICAYCKETYSDLQHLRSHIAAAHANDHLIDNKRMDKSNLSIKIDITGLQCKLCHAACDAIANLKTHLINKHDIKFYPDVNDYILEFKLTDGQILNCALCNSTFETFKMLLQHMNGHYRNYICDICDLGFINKHKLRNHQRTHDIGTFNCSFCDKVFSTRVRKLCHEKYTHNAGARYTTNCPHCDESFTSYYQRNRHMTDAHNSSAATYKCNICDKSFILKSKLTSHIKKVHLMERNHICAECGQGFFIKQSLDEHMIKHNGERIYKCTVCSKAYARKKTLREHMRIHNNDRRFKCGLCPLAFVQKCSLKSHMLSNHGITLAEYESAKTGASSP
ncbi:unnamed protein product [Arctia plantaginis]|uniref:Uncharacterized protein n=1 Tax=Arctia plantaginis TaxID=874455 RepID=A0A8S1BQM3_ARCPL|nr:unnamed protein product [Arctia plantaginis]